MQQHSRQQQQHMLLLEAKQLLDIIRVMWSLGAALIKGSHSFSVHLAATQALHRCVSARLDQQ
jgi:hypothetical protein